MNERRVGLVLSYCLIVVDVVVGLVFTPAVIHLLGNDEYGLYRVIASIASYLAVLDFGIGSTITRYIVKYNTENDKISSENFCAIGLLIYGFLGIIIFVISLAVSFFLPNLFPSSINSSNLMESKIILLFLTGNAILTLFSHAFVGLLSAYRKFVLINSINIIKLVVRATTIIIVLLFYKSAIVIAIVEFFVTLLALLVFVIYKIKRIDLKIKLHKWDFSLVKEIFVFASAIFVQALISQFNGNLDNLLIGALISASAVAIYTIALQLFTIFGGLSTAVLNIFTPSIMEDYFKHDDNDSIIKSLVFPSRIQLIVLSLVYTGYIFWGKQFIVLWIDESYIDAYYAGLILFTAGFVDLIQNNFYSVLKAKNVLHQRTGILIGSTLINFALTIYLIPKYGIVGASIGTAASYILGNEIALNLFYKYYLKLNISQFFKGIFYKLLPPILIATCLGLIISKLIVANSWITLILSIAIYSMIYVVLVLLLGLREDEKNRLLSQIKK